MATSEQIDQMRERITDEIFLAMGLRKTGWLRRLLGRLFYLPTQRFSTLFANADEAASQGGLHAGSLVLKQGLNVDVQARGVENIPGQGPVVVVSNHPGAYDSVAIISCLPRPDVRLIAFEIPFYHALPHIGQQLILAPTDPSARMGALRAAIQHLQSGGILHHFATGRIDPDPLSLPGADAHLEQWSPSLEIMLRKVPQARVVVAMISGVLLPRYARHPFTRLRRDLHDKRRLAEFTQVLTQLAFPRSVCAEARISFDAPVSTGQLAGEASALSGGDRLMPAVLARAHHLLAEHRQYFGLPVNG